MVIRNDLPGDSGTHGTQRSVLAVVRVVALTVVVERGDLVTWFELSVFRSAQTSRSLIDVIPIADADDKEVQRDE
jgi:hypothetical protein